MSVLVRCESCYNCYHAVTRREWFSRGTVTRRDGYCGRCYDNCSRLRWSWSGDVVKMCCSICDHTYLVVTWRDWNQTGTISKRGGYCSSCYHDRQREKERERRERELERRERLLQKELQESRSKMEMMAKSQADMEKRMKEGEEKAEQERKQNTIKMQQIEQDFKKKQTQDKQEYESKIKQTQEKQKEEKRQSEIKLKQTSMQSQQGVLRLKQESLKDVEQELCNKQNLVRIEKDKLNQVLKEIDKQTQVISKKWLNLDIGININCNNTSDEKTFDDESLGLNQSVFKKIQLLQSKLSKMRVLICIGKTGLGKSTFLNRMIGDTSCEGDGEYDSSDEDDDTSGSNECKNDKTNLEVFKVGCNSDSETSEVNHKFIENSINNEIYCLVDTPGSLDSYGRDNEHTNNISEYLRGCGGVNTFCVFVSLCEGTIDKTYIEILQLYNNMLGKNWWKHVVFIGTKFDAFLAGKPKLRKKTGAKREEALNERFNDIINQFKNNKELNIPNELQLKLIPIGHDNYKIAVEQVLSNVGKNKFNCDRIVSPLDKLTNAAKTQQKLVNDMEKEQNQIEAKKKGIENEIESISQMILKIENQLRKLESQTK